MSRRPRNPCPLTSDLAEPSLDERGDPAGEIQERAIRQGQTGRLERRDLVAMHHGKFRRHDIDRGAGAGKPMRARGVAELS